MNCSSAIDLRRPIWLGRQVWGILRGILSYRNGHGEGDCGYLRGREGEGRTNNKRVWKEALPDVFVLRDNLVLHVRTRNEESCTPELRAVYKTVSTNEHQRYVIGSRGLLKMETCEGCFGRVLSIISGQIVVCSNGLVVTNTMCQAKALGIHVGVCEMNK